MPAPSSSAHPPLLRDQHSGFLTFLVARVFAGCVATGSDGYYGDGGYGYGYNRPADTVYVRDGYYDDRYYRERERDRQRAEREREARERERDRDRQARDRDRDQRARDEDRRRELDRQARDRDRERQQRERDNNRSRFGSSSQQQADCARYRDQVRSGSDTINVPSHPC